MSYASGSQGSATWYGTSVTYRQEWFVPYFGFELKQSVGTWAWGAALRVSPYLFANNTDEHVLRKPPLTFNDSVSGGLMIEPSVSNEWIIFPNATWQAQISYRLIWGPRGDKTVSQGGAASRTGLFTIYPGSAGADVQTITISMGLKVSL